MHISDDEFPEVITDDKADESLYDGQQYGMLMGTCLQPVDVAQEIFDQYFNGVFSVAPAERDSPVRVLLNEAALQFGHLPCQYLFAFFIRLLLGCACASV